MTAVVAEGIEGFRELVGTQLGPTDWIEISQERINAFADATLDHQWIHIDAARAAAESPYGGTIAHGYLTLSLIPYFLPQLIDSRGFSMGVNYGSDKVRFPNPVPVDSRLRATGVIDEVTDVPGGIQVRMTVTIEVEGQPKPACVATMLARRYV